MKTARECLDKLIQEKSQLRKCDDDCSECLDCKARIEALEWVLDIHKPKSSNSELAPTSEAPSLSL